METRLRLMSVGWPIQCYLLIIDQRQLTAPLNAIDRPSSAPPPPSMSFLRGARNFIVNNAVMNNIGGDVINNYGSVMHFSFALLHYFH